MRTRGSHKRMCPDRTVAAHNKRFPGATGGPAIREVEVEVAADDLGVYLMHEGRVLVVLGDRFSDGNLCTRIHRAYDEHSRCADETPIEIDGGLSEYREGVPCRCGSRAQWENSEVSRAASISCWDCKRKTKRHRATFGYNGSSEALKEWAEMMSKPTLRVRR